ncbi:MAG: hypothetical protein HHAS10_10260 [Candidatus Altimarinota bacterium]
MNGNLVLSYYGLINYQFLMRNAFDYLEYSFFTLFSKKGIRIIGSSALVDAISSIITIILLYESVILLGKDYIENGTADIRNLILKALLVLLGLTTIGIINVGWKMIVIPIRSLENEQKKLDFSEDIALFKKYFGYYISYVTWYSVFLIIWILGAIGGGILFWMIEKPFLLFLYEVILFGALFFFQIGISLTWYNILIDPTYGIKGLKKGYQLSEGIKWQLFKIIFLFSLVISLASGVITNLNSLLPSPDTSQTLKSFDIKTVSGEAPDINNVFPSTESGSRSETAMPPLQITSQSIESIIRVIEILMPNISITFILMSLEGVLATAMMQIFLMRLTIDVRQDTELSRKKRIETNSTSSLE